MSRYLAWIDTPLNAQISMVEELTWAGVVVPVKPWFIEREDGERIAGPFSTQDDALRARVYVENDPAYRPETFWVRAGIGDNNEPT